MAEGETLKLPKPVIEHDIRSDFLPFTDDRRWEILNLVRPDDVEEIKSCEIGPDGRRYYMVSWKETWKPESALIYCDKLLQDFWSKRSMFQESLLMQSAEAAKLLNVAFDQNAVAIQTSSYNAVNTEQNIRELANAINVQQGSIRDIENAPAPPSSSQSFANVNNIGNTAERPNIGHGHSLPSISMMGTLVGDSPISATLVSSVNALTNVPSSASKQSHFQTNSELQEQAKLQDSANLDHSVQLSHALQLVQQASQMAAEQANQMSSQQAQAPTQEEQVANQQLVQEKSLVCQQNQMQQMQTPLQQTVSSSNSQESGVTVTSSTISIKGETLPSTVNIEGARYYVIVQEPSQNLEAGENIVQSNEEIDIDIHVENEADPATTANDAIENVTQTIPSKDSTSNEENKYKVVESDKNSLKISLMSTSKPLSSRKGAEKRKARIPKPSPRNSKKKKSIKGKDKKSKNTKPKIAKTVGTVINPEQPCNTREDDVDDFEDTTGNFGDDGDDSPVEEGEAEIVDKTKLKCMVCDKYLSSQQNLMKHLLTHNNNHTCQICMKTFKSTHFLKHHMDKHNATYDYTCPVCNKKFKFKNNMRGHLRKHSMEKKFECDICNKKFIGRYNLKEHMKAHSEDRPYACDFCKKAYKDRGALNKHLLTHQEKKVECEICKRPFTNQAQVKRHMQFHLSWPGDSFKRKTNIGPDGEKMKFACEFCGKTFNHYSNMNAHVHKKHKERKVKCDQCDKSFAYQYELREHMFVHTGGTSSKFKCQYCEKSFQRSTTLKNHERTTHLGIKRFKCDICGKMFGTKFNMKVHVEKLHTNPTSSPTASTTLDTKPKRSRGSKADRANATLENPYAIGTNLDDTVNPMHPQIMRNVSTSDIIRNAMSHMPELNYFTGLQPPRGYQFYTIPPPDFGVSSI